MLSTRQGGWLPAAGDPRGGDPVSYHVLNQHLWKDSDELCLGQGLQLDQGLCPEDQFLWLVQSGSQVGEKERWC